MQRFTHIHIHTQPTNNAVVRNDPYHDRAKRGRTYGLFRRRHLLSSTRKKDQFNAIDIYIFRSTIASQISLPNFKESLNNRM